MPFFLSRKKFESEVLLRTTSACDQISEEMGAELHDDIVEKLYVLRLYIDRIEQSSTDPVAVKTLAIKMKVEYDKVARVIGNISHRLRPVRKEGETLVKMLETLCEEMDHPGVAHIHFACDGVQIPLLDSVEMHILRIVRELIQNAFRHSSAWHIWVRLQWEVKKLVIEVEDDGNGFDRISEFIGRLKKKNNTLKMRIQAIGASIDYSKGQKGLLAKIQLIISPRNN